MLAARTGGAENLHLDVRRVELEVHLVHLGQHRHGGGGCVDTPTRLGLRYPLHPVDAALEFQTGPGSVSLNCKADFLHATQFRLVDRVHLHAPAAGIGVHGVHAEQGVGEQSRLLPAHSGADLHDDILVVVGVPGQEQHLDLLLQPGQLLPGLLVLLLGQLLHIRSPIRPRHPPDPAGGAGRPGRP